MSATLAANKKLKKMKTVNLNQEISKIMKHGAMEDYDKGYNPVEDIICQIEYDSDYDPEIEDENYRKILLDDDLIEQYENYKEHVRWECRCRLREEMAPGFYEAYFQPFFNSTLKEVYDNELTEELKYYNPTFDEWLFMILAVMTEYYFREKYPFSYDRMDWFKLELNRGSTMTEVYNRYSAITW